jgi:hypothetical protein
MTPLEITLTAEVARQASVIEWQDERMAELQRTVDRLRAEKRAAEDQRKAERRATIGLHLVRPDNIIPLGAGVSGGCK